MNDTNYECMKSLSLEELGSLLCDLMAYIKVKDSVKEDPCDYCPMTDRCSQGNSGWKDYLKDDWKKGGN